MKKSSVKNILFSEVNVKTYDNFVSPLQVTHKGGKGEPFHDWYPYLEGFSPDFVKWILNKYMPNARKIIEPFAGTGTTPIALSTIGIECVFCEVNPAMRLIVDAKVAVGSLPKSERIDLAHELTKLADRLPHLVKKAEPDIGLQIDYANNFFGSEFFEASGMSDVLALRSINDAVLKKNKTLGNLFTIAVMAKIVICSRLKRVGDVRYKSEKELAKGLPSFPAEISKHLLLMAKDCLNAENITQKVSIATNNARHLKQCKSLNADGVITSPPYLNGTNYFRNTKLELWFGRYLSNGVNLRSFRDEAITSGINDVGKEHGRKIVHAAIQPIFDALSINAYDQRIPRMVAGYFEDMQHVFDGLISHCKSGATICIDIGDSKYGGVHVPTDEILVVLGCELGLEHIETIHLRKRTSKDRSVLSQSLIVFRKR